MEKAIEVLARRVEELDAENKRLKREYAFYVAENETLKRACGAFERHRELSANEYQELAARTINSELCCFQQIIHALFGMAGEVGELHSLYQKRYQGHEFDDEHAKKELGDILWMIAEYCTANGWKLGDVMKMNINKLKERYPDGFEEGKSLNRKEGDV